MVATFSGIRLDTRVICRRIDDARADTEYQHEEGEDFSDPYPGPEQAPTGVSPGRGRLPRRI